MTSSTRQAQTRRTRRVITYVTSLGTALALTACASLFEPGAPTTRTHNLSNVEEVELRTSGHLTIVAGDSEALTVNAGMNIIDNLTYEIRDGTLVLDAIASDSGWNQISYTLVVPGLRVIRLAGSGDISAADVFRGTGTLEVSGSGSASLDANNTSDLRVTIEGSGDVTIVGASTSLELSSEGSGNFNGKDLQTNSATLELSGSGSAQVAVSQSLDAHVSGSGDLSYTGQPADITSSITGSGEITPLPKD